jgi:hypothetical protein
MREFSEPLMRRLVRIDFKYLDPSDVAELLKRRFDGQTADLLAEIYRDTVAAGLRKPATLQELIQLGYVLKKMPDAPLDRLLRMFVIKYEDDWEKYKEYLEKKLQETARRQKEQILQQMVDLQQTAPQQSARQEAQAQQQLVSYAERVLGGVSEPAGAASVETYTFKAYMSDDIYTAIAKMYPPGDAPDELGKFRVIEVGGDRVVVSKEPLTIDEFFRLYNNTTSGFEAYIEDKVPLVLPDDLKSLIEKADVVKSYSKRAVHLASKSGDEVEEEVLIELPEPYSPSGPAKLVEATVKARVSVYAADAEYGWRRSTPLLLDKIWGEMLGNFCGRRLTYRDGVGRVAADIAGICAESNKHLNLAIEGHDLDDNAVSEIEKAVAERVQPLGLSVVKKCEGGRYGRIYIEKSQRWPEVRITCYQ